MEHWNKEDKSKMKDAEQTIDSIIELSQQDIDCIYEYFSKSLHTTSYTLAQVQWISYVENYARDMYEDAIDEYKFRGCVAAESLIHECGQSKVLFATHKRIFNDRINCFFDAIFGKGTNISVFEIPGEKQDEFKYEIKEKDLIYLLLLYDTFESQDAQYLIINNYSKVSDEYISFIVNGAEELARKGDFNGITADDLRKRLNVDFRLKQRIANKKLQNLKNEFHIIESIVEEFIKKPLNFENIDTLCEKCFDILEDCQRDLFKFRNKFMHENKISSSEIEKIIKKRSSINNK